MTLNGKEFQKHRVSGGFDYESRCSTMGNVTVIGKWATTAPRQRCEFPKAHHSNRSRDNRVSGWRTGGLASGGLARPGMGAGAAGSRRQT
ncbi:hypothetical protein, partial [Mycolicibacterium neoaurum]|uniref:hypothetical protein n=1 Tax=Mycolicibacterium neoaurum TaxID=1795 RepID=UPI001F4D2063